MIVSYLHQILRGLLAYCFTDFFVRQMSSQINSVFKAIKENLQDTTIETALEVSSIIEEFDIAQELKEDKTPGILKNVALGKS